MEKQRRIPGEAGVWIIIFADLMVFSILFGNYAWARTQTADGHVSGLSTVDQGLGAFNTVLLLTSSWFVAVAMVAARANQRASARRWLLAASGCAAMFVAVKAIEYALKISAGHLPASGTYYTYYFTLTGLHLVHVLIGSGVLFWMRARVTSVESDHDLHALECGASFWHMVDLLWILIFPLIYYLAFGAQSGKSYRPFHLLSLGRPLARSGY
jgi:nitric oxide reductase NorE protein